MDCKYKKCIANIDSKCQAGHCLGIVIHPLSGKETKEERLYLYKSSVEDFWIDKPGGAHGISSGR